MLYCQTRNHLTSAHITDFSLKKPTSLRDFLKLVVLFFSSSQIHSKKVQTEADELTHVNLCHLSLRLISSVVEWMSTPRAKLQNRISRKIPRPRLVLRDFL